MIVKGSRVGGEFHGDDQSSPEAVPPTLRVSLRHLCVPGVSLPRWPPLSQPWQARDLWEILWTDSFKLHSMLLLIAEGGKQIKVTFPRLLCSWVPLFTHSWLECSSEPSPPPLLAFLQGLYPFSSCPDVDRQLQRLLSREARQRDLKGPLVPEPASSVHLERLKVSGLL